MPNLDFGKEGGQLTENQKALAKLFAECFIELMKRKNVVTAKSPNDYLDDLLWGEKEDASKAFRELLKTFHVDKVGRAFPNLSEEEGKNVNQLFSALKPGQNIQHTQADRLIVRAARNAIQNELKAQAKNVKVPPKVEVPPVAGSVPPVDKSSDQKTEETDDFYLGSAELYLTSEEKAQAKLFAKLFLALQGESGVTEANLNALLALERQRQSRKISKGANEVTNAANLGYKKMALQFHPDKIEKLQKKIPKGVSVSNGELNEIFKLLVAVQPSKSGKVDDAQRRALSTLEAAEYAIREKLHPEIGEQRRATWKARGEAKEKEELINTLVSIKKEIEKYTDQYDVEKKIVGKKRQKTGFTLFGKLLTAHTEIKYKQMKKLLGDVELAIGSENITGIEKILKDVKELRVENRDKLTGKWSSIGKVEKILSVVEGRLEEVINKHEGKNKPEKPVQQHLK